MSFFSSRTVEALRNVTAPPLSALCWQSADKLLVEGPLSAAALAAFAQGGDGPKQMLHKSLLLCATLSKQQEQLSFKLDIAYLDM